MPLRIVRPVATAMLLFLATAFAWPQEPRNPPDSAELSRKEIRAVRTDTPPKIDGRPDEAAWQSAPAAGDFVEYSPRSGTWPVFPTEVRFLYDDMALYILAVMHDPAPDSICREMGRRDQLEQISTDYISFDILPYNDGLNMYEFKVGPANNQHDCKYSPTGQDITWDAVWETATSVTSAGWIVEAKIPYSALRFPKTAEQRWGINMWRNNLRYHEYSTWSWVDINSQDIFRYYGTLTGIRDINPPVRLSFSPYFSGYVEKTPDEKKWSSFLRGGLDLRYGLNESYTLDMMLIPDFGQVPSDDQVLNLSPFEIRYDEKRQFFTEGTELFNKCEIFYTRRVGDVPKNYDAPYEQLNENEIVSENPELTRLINATKISGRNAKGLGIGFFNGMTTNTHATVRDTITGENRRIMTQPFTNYNVTVLDQNLKNNSYVSLINTNYWTPDDGYSANVTGSEINIRNRKNTIQAIGRLNVSQKYHSDLAPDFGHQAGVALSKPSGKFQWELVRIETSNTYDPNDMGFILYNNEVYNEGSAAWKDHVPKKKVISSGTEFKTIWTTLYKPREFVMLEFSASNEITFVKYWYNSVYASFQPLGYHDYFEPRMAGRVYKTPLNYHGEWTFASDAKKPFRYLHTLGFTNSPEDHHFIWNAGVSPRFRFSDRLSVSLSLRVEREMNDYGWVSADISQPSQPVIFFGRRDITTFNNVLDARLIFSTKTSLTMRARHYWSQAKYLSFYTLGEDGCLDETAFIEGMDINFNALTVDLQFVWYFAPGSEISVVWKNLINTLDDRVAYDYFRNFSDVVKAPQTNSFSLRVLYYIDFMKFKKKPDRKNRYQ